jgi:hypothetical protein
MDRLQPSKGLRGKILASIQQEEIRHARIYVYTAIGAIMTSSFGVVFVVKHMFQGLYQSSFYSYVSLLFSDPAIVVSYWKELSLSLVETAPLIEITLCLVAFAALLTSVRILVNNAKPQIIPLFNN